MVETSKTSPLWREIRVVPKKEFVLFRGRIRGVQSRWSEHKAQPFVGNIDILQDFDEFIASPEEGSVKVVLTFACRLSPNDAM
jgi:hypothetical protein